MIRLALRSVRTHARQFILTTLAVVLGVTFLSGTLSLRAVMSDTFAALTSSTVTADLYVSGEPVGTASDNNAFVPSMRVDSSLAESVRQVEGVKASFPNASVGVTLVGADATPVASTGAPSMAIPLYPDEPGGTLVSGVLPQSEGEVALESDALRRSGLALGDTTHLVVDGAPYEVTVVGEISFGASMAGATIVGMEPGWLMSFAAPDGKVSSISIYLDEGADQSQVSEAVADLLPDRTRLQTRDELLKEQNSAIEKILGYAQTFLMVFVVLAMFVGSFIIMNTFAMSVRQRQKEFALLRAVGASPGSVFATVVLQALVIGTVGSLLGVAGGAGLTRLLVAGLEAVGMPLPGGVPLTRTVVLASVAAGVSVTVIGALLPARTAALTPPVEAMRGPAGAREKPLRARGILGLLLSGAGLVALVMAWLGEGLPGRARVLGAGAAGLVLGLLVFSPVLARYTIGVLSVPLRLIRPVGRLAARNLAAAPRRTAATSAALLIGMALVSAGTIIAASMKASVDEIVNNSMHADLLVGQVATSVPAQIPAQTASQIQQVDGVASTTSYVAQMITVTGPQGDTSTGFMVGIDPVAYASAYDPGVIEGSLDMLDQSHVAAFASSDLSLGDEVTLSGSNGTVTATVAAVADTKGVNGTVYVTPEVMSAVGSLTTVVPTDPSQVLSSPHWMFVTLEDGASLDEVQKEIEEIVAPSYVFNVLDRSQLSDQIGSQATRMLAVLYGLLGLSLVIAVLGIVNTLVLSVSERTREIGLMRAVGLGKTQIAGEITSESVLTAVYGTVVGTATGVVLAGSLRALLEDQGLTTLVIPWGQLAVMLVVAVVVGVLAALWPALRAARLPVLQAIATE